MAQVDLFLDDDDIQGANTAGQFTFTPPDDANKRGELSDPTQDKARATWVQTLEIAESKMYEDSAKDKDGNEYPAIVIELLLQVPSDAIRPKTGAADPNAGRQSRQWLRVVPEAMKNKQHPRYKANNFALSQALGILRGIWGTDVIPHGSRPNLGDFYGSDQPAVLGKQITCTITQSRYEKTGKLQDNFSDFVPLELLGA